MYLWLEVISDIIDNKSTAKQGSIVLWYFIYIYIMIYYKIISQGM
jgi:hypothetical protein